MRWKDSWLEGFEVSELCVAGYKSSNEQEHLRDGERWLRKRTAQAERAGISWERVLRSMRWVLRMGEKRWKSGLEYPLRTGLSVMSQLDH